MENLYSMKQVSSDSTSNYYLNGNLFRIDVDGSNNKQLAKNFDESLIRLRWNKNGIFAIAWQKTLRKLIRIDPENGQTTIINNGPERIWNYSFSARW